MEHDEPRKLLNISFYMFIVPGLKIELYCECRGKYWSRENYFLKIP